MATERGRIVFVQIAKSICPNCQKNISGTQYAQVQDSGDGEGEEGDGGGRRGEEQEERQESGNIRIVFFQIAKCICPNCKMYLSKLPKNISGAQYADEEKNKKRDKKAST